MEILRFILIGLIPIVTVLFLYKSYKKFDWLKSISAYYYEYRKEKKGYLFISFIGFLALSFIIIGNNWLISIAGILLSCVAISPAFRDEPWKSDKVDKLEERVHIIGATGSILVGALFAISINLGWLLIPSLLFSLYAISKNPRYKTIRRIKYYTYWIEIAWLSNLWLVLLIYNIIN